MWRYLECRHKGANECGVRLVGWEEWRRESIDQVGGSMILGERIYDITWGGLGYDERGSVISHGGSMIL